MVLNKKLKYFEDPTIYSTQYHHNNAKAHTASITNTMASQEKSPGAELACLQFRPFTNTKYLANHKTKKSGNEGTILLSNYNPTSDKNLTTLLSKNSSSWSFRFPDVNRQLLIGDASEW